MPTFRESFKMIAAAAYALVPGSTPQEGYRAAEGVLQKYDDMKAKRAEKKSPPAQPGSGAG